MEQLVGEVMVSVVWDAYRFLFIDYLGNSQTVNSVVQIVRLKEEIAKKKISKETSINNDEFCQKDVG